jgi:hypothetical protein
MINLKLLPSEFQNESISDMIEKECNLFEKKKTLQFINQTFISDSYNQMYINIGFWSKISDRCQRITSFLFR